MSDFDQIDNLTFKEYTKIMPKTEEEIKYWYLGDYIPKTRHFISGKTQDNFSKTIINFKNGDNVSIFFFLKKLKAFLSKELMVKKALFINVPTSKQGEKNSITKIIDLLCNQEDNYINCSNYLVRSKNVTPSHKLKKSKKQDLNRHNDSIFLKNKEDFIDQNILLIDDLVTTCTTLFVCKKKILESTRPIGISCLVFGRTIDIDK